MIINGETNRRSSRRRGIAPAILLILFGIILVGRNLSYIPWTISNIIISWQMLLIVLGVISLSSNNVKSGVVLIFIGSFFLMPEIPYFNFISFRDYWPIIFILLGITLLIKRNDNREFANYKFSENREFLEVNTTFGSSQNIVKDPIFKGAFINNTFGESIIDLRQTSLKPGDNFIDVKCSFGAVTIYLPSGWNVKIYVKNSFGSSTDKRFNLNSVDSTNTLIIRGSVSFGELLIKD